MTVTRNVIEDLLPVYAAGEASSDTVALVEAYLADHPDMGGMVAGLREEGLPEIVVQTKEKETLDMTRKMLRTRSILMGVAIYSTCTLGSFTFSNGKITWMFLQGSPVVVTGLMVLVAVASWVGYFAVRRRLENTGL